MEKVRKTLQRVSSYLRAYCRLAAFWLIAVATAALNVADDFDNAVSSSVSVDQQRSQEA